MRSAFARLIDHFLPVCIRFCQNFLVTRLRFGQFFLDLFGVDLALFDLASALFQKSKDRFVSEPLQKERNNAEANDLRQNQLPVPAEHISCFTHNVADASAGGSKYRYHKIKLVHAQANLPARNKTIYWAKGRARRTRSPRLTRWREFRARALA